MQRQRVVGGLDPRCFLLGPSLTEDTVVIDGYISIGFIFRAVVGPQKNCREGTEVAHTPRLTLLSPLLEDTPIGGAQQ